MFARKVQMECVGRTTVPGKNGNTYYRVTVAGMGFTWSNMDVPKETFDKFEAGGRYDAEVDFEPVMATVAGGFRPENVLKPNILRAVKVDAQGKPAAAAAAQ